MDISLNSCEAEYFKDSNIKKEDIQQLIEWRDKQNYLPEISEHVLILFYRCCDYSLQQSKDLISFHYSYRNEASEFFNGKDYESPKYDHKYFDITYFLDLNSCTSEGCRLIFTALKDYDPNKYNFTVSVNMLIRTLFTIELEKGSCPGYVFIWDMTGTTAGHMLTASVQLLRKFITYIQEGVPLKVKRVHVINVLPLLSRIMMLVRPFIKRELLELLQFHNDMESFYKEIPRELLPNELGGTQTKSLNELNEETRDKVYAHWKSISSELALRADPNKCPNVSQNGSMSGSFKKLSID